MKTFHQVYDFLQKKKDTGQSMTGHERMELHYLTEIIILKDRLQEAEKLIDKLQASEQLSWKLINEEEL